ncbi:hypothetical protein CUJ88_10450 [Paraburkholderia hospita]|uniref:Uncharacterized protein n=2 Tax=Burkholderiaceae TaxID=119060 RepID=A0AAN1J7G5_9BURK|nr:hypothetical protein C2L64_10640 [Paraburkholderia hospita]AXE98848.1 hypothetical protein CUJ88_10450 [Paraburkholderia hospita]
MRDAVCRQVSFNAYANNARTKNTDEITDDAVCKAMLENTKAKTIARRLSTDRECRATRVLQPIRGANIESQYACVLAVRGMLDAHFSTAPPLVFKRRLRR